MKSERLIALLFTLQARRSATAGQLAAILEVSERTILRDVAALQASGVPLYSEPGRGGGIRLLDGWRTRLDGLTGPEAAALFVAGVPAALADLGLAGAASTAQAKLLATLPADARERAQELGERFHLDAPGWFHRDEDLPCLADVAAAVWDRQRLIIRYERGSRVVERIADPLGLVLKAGIWYAVARTDGAYRTYRVSRIRSADRVGEQFDRPEGFVLAEYWAQSAAEFDRSILHATVRVRVPGRVLPDLARHLGRTSVEGLGAIGPPGSDGWVEVELLVETVHIAHHQLIALAPDVEVLDPPELRAALAETGRKLAARNSPEA
ncbi:MAG: YafY family transcriptional regulator [Hamadaea sp.]|uniref:helix-turn-helix transcriptional regulator n=1 Tax=Hamadaea sp. TaxID=2024425 RepID=UPI0018445042|nr:YafY family protein [Hamadaea sp.]NUR72982.1 YafY family transcriptional regulator [Hamadaea sp.]NUT21231.1 YafY family transcriptional regulator [Hamadaea sp.]